MSDSIGRASNSKYLGLGYDVQHWQHGGLDVLALHKEPFRIATQLVTFVFLIPRAVRNYDEIVGDYRGLRGYAGANKRTWLPIAFNCVYALLPIYVGLGFSGSLKASIRSKFKKRWCVFHIPSLFDLDSRELITFTGMSLWGCIYRPYITKTIKEVADCIGPDYSGGTNHSSILGEQ